jgi:DNA-binding NtrC family response regulator
MKQFSAKELKMSKLLIVDDEIDIREFAKRFFMKRGLTVFTAGGGLQALKIISEERPDLVLLDVQVEEINGIEVLKRLREASDTTKVIMVTGAENPDIVSEANRLGARGYIHKPLVLEELEEIVMRELGERG